MQIGHCVGHEMVFSLKTIFQSVAGPEGMTGYSIRKSNWWKLANQIQSDKERQQQYDDIVFKFKKTLLREF